MRIMVIGANGQLGSELIGVLGEEEKIPLTHSDLEIKYEPQVRKVLRDFTPELVINTAAFHVVAECEKNDLEAFQVNALGVKYLALACKKYGSTLLHISTDYIFDGLKRTPYIETDVPNPLNVYGITKLAGEHYLRSILEEHFIVRTTGLYGIHTCRAKKGGSFVDLMLRLAKERDEIRVVDDQILTPTYTLDLANQIKALITTKNYGTYHATNGGQCSWYDFAKAIFDLLNMEINLRRTSSTEFPSPAKRPSYSVLENRALKHLGIDKMRDWKEALSACLREKRLL